MSLTGAWTKQDLISQNKESEVCFTGITGNQSRIIEYCYAPQKKFQTSKYQNLFE